LHINDIVVTHEIDISKIGVYQVEYRIQDHSYNETILYLEYRVDDSSKPHLSFSELTLAKNELFNPMQGVTVSEHSTKVTVSCYPFTIDTGIPGTYELIYIATDERGNSTKLHRTITVLPEKDEIQMTSYLPMAAVMMIGVGLAFYFWKKI